MNAETDLRAAIAYLADLDAELDERGALANASAHAPAGADMRYQLDQTRALLAGVERHAPTLSCLTFHNGREMLIDSSRARAWCHAVEVRIAGLLCGNSAAA